MPDLGGLRDLSTRNSTAFSVKSHSAHAPYFLYVGDYGAEMAGTDIMNLAEFLNFMFDDRESARADDTCTYRLFSVEDLDGEVYVFSLDGTVSQLVPA